MHCESDSFSLKSKSEAKFAIASYGFVNTILPVGGKSVLNGYTVVRRSLTSQDPRCTFSPRLIYLLYSFAILAEAQGGLQNIKVQSDHIRSPMNNAVGLGMIKSENSANSPKQRVYYKQYRRWIMKYKTMLLKRLITYSNRCCSGLFCSKVPT